MNYDANVEQLADELRELCPALPWAKALVLIEKFAARQRKMTPPEAFHEAKVLDALDDLDRLSQQLYSRLQSGDIPWNAAGDIQGEFCDEITSINRRVRAILVTQEVPHGQ